jgi:type II secretory pathway component GspD/PulD (secretin)
MYCDKIENDKMKIRKSFILWGFVLITLIVTTAAGANAATGKPPQVIDKFDVEEDFDVRKALAMLGSLCDKNIVPSPNVNGALAFRSLKNVTFEEAMDAILGEGFKYEEDGKLIKVYTKDEYKQLKEDPARMMSKVFTLYYIKAAEAQNLIAPVLSDNAKVQVNTEAETGVSAGEGGSGVDVTVSIEGGGDTMALNDMIVVYDYPENLEKVAEVLKSIDIRPKQVLVEATILSATLNETTKFGIDWNLFTGVNITDFPANLVGGHGTTMETFDFADDPVTARGLTAGFSADNVQAIITALETTTDITILANPKILAVNKQEGFVQIGQKLGYVNQTTQNQSGSTTQAVDFLDTGTLLTFRPYIGNDGYIRMDIFPKDSSGDIVDSLPQENLTTVRTNVMVKDGETIVIGGLFRDVVNTSRSQVPILGDIPFVGAIFRGTTDITERQEVVVLLTPHIIEEPSQVDGKARAEDISRKRFGAEDSLQWMDRSRLAEDSYAAAARFYIEGDNESAMKKLKVALTLRPTYLEAIRLKEKIMAEVNPQEAQMLDRILQEKIDNQDAANWSRK